MPDAVVPPKIITFDCYGTLVQWREVLLKALEDILARRGRADLQAPDLLDTFSQFSRRLETERPHKLYKKVLRGAFRSALEQYGLQPSAEDVEGLASLIPTMGPHPEVPEALRRLRKRFKLAIFTNSDEDLIVHNVERLGVPIDYVITAERAQAYKPSHRIFEHGYRTMGVTKDETVHVAAGMYLDMKACHELQVRAVWINRQGQRGDPQWLPYDELPDLAGVPGLLGA